MAEAGINIFGYGSEFFLDFPGVDDFSFGSGLLTGFFADGSAFEIIFDADDGFLYAWDNTTLVDIGGPISVPEPGTLALLGISLFGVGLARKRRSAA